MRGVVRFKRRCLRQNLVWCGIWIMHLHIYIFIFILIRLLFFAFLKFNHSYSNSYSISIWNIDTVSLSNIGMRV